jgi:hypothetical protein
MADSGKLICYKCRWDRLRQLEGKLENALHKIEDLERKKKGLEKQLRAAACGYEVGRLDTVRRKDGGANCLVLGNSIIRNVKSEHMSVECFPGIRTEELKIILENKDLGRPDTVVIHVGTNDLR